MEHVPPAHNRIPLYLFTIAIIVILGLAIYLLSKRDVPPKDTRIPIAVSFYPLGAFAEAVGGQQVSVSVITPAGAEPHEYEPSPRDIAVVQSSKLFLYEGNGFESWPDKMKHDLQAKGVRVLRMSDTITENIKGDPHAWLDPELAKQMVAAINTELKTIDAAHAAEYDANTSRYLARLDTLHAAYAQSLASCTQRTIIVSHNAFQYMARRYNLNTEYISGLSPDEEPSPRQIATLAALAKSKQVRYIFFETLVSPKIAETVASEAGADTLVLDPIEGLAEGDKSKGVDYIRLMEGNLTNLKTALECP